MIPPNEKATELITKYFISNPGYGPMERDRARRNAIMGVNEIINTLNNDIRDLDVRGNILLDLIKYWQEVKTDLEQNETK